jgi:hypothetical protein
MIPNTTRVFLKLTVHTRIADKASGIPRAVSAERSRPGTPGDNRQ